jgi:phenylpropionate dioxygenase-like ring-hydroxylating dioxygenase large terminal subunit
LNYTAASIAALVEDDRVHRDVYLSPELFALEQQQFFAHTWLYYGHTSQVPNAGDYLAQDLAGRPLVMVRQPDGGIRVLYNRCAHKGTRLVSDESGTVGRFFRCPYHAWTYKLDGSPLAVPIKAGYEGTRLKDCESGQGMTALKHVAVYRDFVFVKLGDAGPGFEGYFGEALRAIDNLVDRSPVGKLRIEGGVLRNIVHCNWKMYLENINDTVHPPSTHESATAAAGRLWEGQPADAPKPMAMEQILPFAASYDFFDRLGGRVYPNVQSLLGDIFRIHSGFAALPEY